MIIKRTEFSQLLFTQTGNSCVLASYGVCAYPFIHKDIEEFFQGYCEHFGLGNLNKTHEELYNDHFHNYHKQQNLTGYQLINCLYHTSQIRIFDISRNNLKLVSISNDVFKKLKDLVNTEKRVMLMVFCNNRSHSISVGYDEQGYFMYDTQPGKGLLPIHDIDIFKSSCNPGDTFLIEEL